MLVKGAQVPSTTQKLLSFYSRLINGRFSFVIVAYSVQFNIRLTLVNNMASKDPNMQHQANTSISFHPSCWHRYRQSEVADIISACKLCFLGWYIHIYIYIYIYISVNFKNYCCYLRLSGNFLPIYPRYCLLSTFYP